MPYATVRYTVPAPNHGYNLPRVRRNTMESSGRQHNNMIQLVRASQQQQYAYEYMDDRSSFVRAQREEEERIQQDMERAMRAQRRDKARKFARASKATEQGIPNAVNDWQHGGNVRRPAVEDIGRQAVPTQPPARMAPHAKHTAQRSVVTVRRPSADGTLLRPVAGRPSVDGTVPRPVAGRRPSVTYPQQPVGILRPSTERARLETFKFPQAESKTYARPPPLQPYIVARSPPPLPSPNKRLAPIPRFNPFARARSESLSSLIHDEQLGKEPVKRKRNVSVSALFARIHREVDNYRTRQGENRY